MGRRKLNMEFICKEKARILTFNKRKESLMKKLHELTTLCDISACMIIYGPVQENRAVEPEIWPQNRDEIHRLIDIYKAKNDDSGHSRSSGLSDFFHERERKAEEELAKLRKKNAEANEFLNFLNVAELRALIAVLNHKSEIVKSRIEFLKREKQESDDRVVMNMKMMGFAPPNLSQFYALNLDQDINPIVDMNCASFGWQVFCDQEAAAAAGDGRRNQMMYYNQSRPLLPQIYYAPPMLQPVPPPPPPCYLQWPVISGVAPPVQLQWSSTENLNYHDNGGER